MSNTLVIHPIDESTEMLKLVYQNKDYDVIDDPDICKETLINEIIDHDRIIFLGHGLPNGLIHPGARLNKNFNMNRLYIIDFSFKDVLKDKVTISMWCYSDLFFRNNGLHGFHTGMIISEPDESIYALGHCNYTREEIHENVARLSKLLGECIDFTPEDIKAYLLEHYTGDDEITIFNRNNLIIT